MQKRKGFVVKGVGLFQVFLIVMFTFSLGVILSESGVVSAEIIYERGGFVGGVWKANTEGGFYRGVDGTTQRVVGVYTPEQYNNNIGSSSGGTVGVGANPPPQTPATTTPPPVINKPIGSGTQAWKDWQALVVKQAAADAKVVEATEALKALKAAPVPDPTKIAEAEKALKGLQATAEAAGTAASSAQAYSYKLPFVGTELVGGYAHLAQGAIWAATLYFGVKFLLPAVGVDKGISDALANGALAGVLTYKGLLAVGSKSGAVGFGWLKPGNFLVQHAGLIGIGVGVAVFLATYKKEEEKVIQFQCLPYEPPLGGSSCDKCNEDPFRPCSEYRCKSLGQACEIVNSGTKDEACVWVSRNDVTSPTITPWDEALSDEHSYVSHDTRPPSLGTKIVKDGAKDGCLQAFTPLEFGVKTNEPAQCKIDFGHTGKLDEMTFYFGESNLYIEEHKQMLSLPGPDSLKAESPELENNGIYDLYVRCRDANGNENVDEFVFSFCVDPSPDTTPPLIVETSIPSNSPVTYNISSVDIEVYVNEPASCKWGVQDKNYEDMENSMSCTSSVSEINARLSYACGTTLTGIKDRVDNKYYFRCKDQPKKPENERNVNVQSYVYTLKGTQPLNILSSGPNETITDSTDVVGVDLTVETSNGAEEGNAICYFSDTNDEGSFVAMFESGSFEHKQTLSLRAGTYTYYFRCVDAGGNSDVSQTTFNVETDTSPPLVTRAYKEIDALKIVTNEDAECVYSLNSCNYNFEEGLDFIYSNPSIRSGHFVGWKLNLVYYIKCRDDFNNQPAPSECSLIASAGNIR